MDQGTKLLGIRQVINKGFCIGCGTCAVIDDAAKISFNRYGELVASIQDCAESEIATMEAVCPFSISAPNETLLAQKAFEREPNLQQGSEIGFFNGLYAGYSHIYRKWGSSGGIVGWLLSQLLISGKVDKVIVVGKTDGGERFFDFQVVTDPDALKVCGTSFYYPVSYDKALQYIIDNPGRYAITGVPCFHKALRQLKLVNPVIAERVVYQVGIVCGQMKSAFYLDYLSRKTGTDAQPIDACFRRKDEASRADDYLFEGRYNSPTDGVEIRTVRNNVIGSNWAMGLFKPRACDFCDDVFAETADISVMDAWLDRYVTDGKGTSLVVTRTAEVQDILLAGKETGDLQLEESSESDVVESQRGGLNHRRVGLRYRLFVDGSSESAPKKRVQPSSQLDAWFKTEQRIRSAIRERSRLAMRKQIDSGNGGLTIYENEMKGILRLFKWFGRFRSRISARRDYKAQFKLDI